MNVNLLYHQIMNQLGAPGLPHPPYPRYPESLVKHHQDRMQESLVKHHQDRMQEMQQSVSASLAQLKPYELARSPELGYQEGPQDLSLRLPPPLRYSPAYPGPGLIKRESSPSQALGPGHDQPQVKTEPPEDPGYSLQELGQVGGGHHGGHPDLCRSYSLPAREPSDHHSSLQRPVSVDRSQGSGGQSRAKQEGPGGPGGISTSRTIIGRHPGLVSALASDTSTTTFLGCFCADI